MDSFWLCSNVRQLSQGQVKELNKFLQQRYGCEFEEKYLFIEAGKQKIRLTSAQLKPLLKLKTKLIAAGMYAARRIGPHFRLSLEGAQYLVRKAVKNVVELDEQQVELWMKGRGVEVGEGKAEPGFVILTYKNYCLGVGKYDGRMVQNYLPKARRIY